MVADRLPIGAYDALITNELAGLIDELPLGAVVKESLEIADSPEILARHLYFIIRGVLAETRESGDSPDVRINLSNRIIEAVNQIAGLASDGSSRVSEGESEQVLTAVLTDAAGDFGNVAKFESPSVRLSQSALLVNGRNQPSIGYEIRRELTSADDVLFIVSFLKNSGVNLIASGVRDVISRGGRVRVLTTTYMGATEKLAVDKLHSLGAEIKISYDTTRTRLHAKSWIFRRKSGFSTGYVGSSNLSAPAMQDGVEWNIRVAAAEQPHIVQALETMFDDTWHDSEFVTYVPSRDGEILSQSLREARAWNSAPKDQGIFVSFSGLDVEPRPFQQEVLDQLSAERAIHGRHHNLVVMATGTGKTVVAALDFRRLFESGEAKSLLFVAHRKEILSQGRNVFRSVLKSGSFGELLVDGERPTQWINVFASVQSLSQIDLSELNPSKFDMVIVDEFHHAAADTYVRVLDYFKPKYLLGLTATPERTDGLPISQWFGGVYAAELRLWEAIDKAVLCPFQYFGIYDNVDLDSRVSWLNGKYNSSELSNVYTGDKVRAALILRELEQRVSSLDEMKAIGFCVSVEHARFMTEVFSQAGIPAECVVGETTSENREQALLNLRTGKTKVIFARDIFNEGVDVPEVNTLLMLRPTESATVFLQQLGRGLRRTPTKNCLTVLDFVGNQNKNFRFDQKYGRLLGVGKKKLSDGLESGFLTLPLGCHFELDEVALRIVLGNIKQSLKFSARLLRENLLSLGDVSITRYVIETGMTLEDLYRGQRSFTVMKKLAFEPDYVPTNVEVKVGRAMRRLLHVDDVRRIDAYRALMKGEETIDKRYRMMLGGLLFGPDQVDEVIDSALAECRRNGLADEIAEVLELLSARIAHVTVPESKNSVLEVHGTYSRVEIGAGFGVSQIGTSREGVFFDNERGIDFAFVTLHKTEKHFSPTTMYADTAIDNRTFQWESQSLTSETSVVGRRYIQQPEAGTSFHLFVREHKTDPESGATMAYKYFGPATYLSHEGSRPMRIRWRLHHQLPAEFLMVAKVLSA